MSSDSERVPVCDLSHERDFVGVSAAALQPVITANQYVGSHGNTHVRDFETALAFYVNQNVFANLALCDSAEYARFPNYECVACANGTDAVELAVRAVASRSRVPAPQQRVAVPDFTFIASGTGAALAGIAALDCMGISNERGNYHVTPEHVRSVLTPQTIAVIYVSLFGDVGCLASVAHEIDAYNADHGTHIVLIEDAAQSFGNPQSCIHTDISCVSFYPSKPLGACGDAGALVCTPEWSSLIKSLSMHGVDLDDDSARYLHQRLGRNSRMDAFQAVLLSAKLAKLDTLIKARRYVAEVYTRSFEHLAVRGALSLPRVTHTHCSYAQFTIQLNDAETRDALATHLTSRNIGHSVFYPVPLHAQPALEGIACAPRDERAVSQKCDSVLSLPLYAFMPRDMLLRVVDAVLDFFGASRSVSCGILVELE